MAGHSTAPQRSGRPLVSSKAVTTLVLLAAALTLIMQNRQRIEILLFVPTVTAPLWLVLAGMCVIGLAVGYLLAWRRR
jgi:uncharacterized integral membrane protein